MNFKERKPVRKTRKKLSKIEKPAQKLTAILVIIALGAGIYGFAFSGGDAVEGTFFMRADEHTVNDYTSSVLNQSQSSNVQSDFVESSTGGQDVSWGARVFTVDENSTVEEITGGEPVAQVTRSAAGSGIQSANYTLPQTDLHYNDTLLVRIYIQVGSNNYQQRAEFITEDLNASQIPSRDWRFNYFTEYETETGGAPFNRFTRGTFYWGDPSVDSRIEGLNYTKARVDAEQIEPSAQVETYPEDTFNHNVSLSCEASSCKDVQVNPQICQGTSCTNFQDIDGSEGLDWNDNSKNIGTLSRGQEVNESFEVTPSDEGEYRIRFNVSSSNVRFDNTTSEIVDVHVADVNLTSLEHENQIYGTNQYETGDTIDYFNTTFDVSGGRAFDLATEAEFISPSGTPADWGPTSSRECGDVLEGETCEKQFSSYDIPVDAETGAYSFLIDYSWLNTGDKTNESNSFEVVDVRGTFSSDIQPDSIFRGQSSIYQFSMDNDWNEQITDVNVTVNCDEEQLNCTEDTSSYTASLAAGEEFSPRFNISTDQNTDTGFYNINANVTYSNPGENKEWVRVEDTTLKVSSGDSLLTSIRKLPDNTFKAEYYHNITYTDTSGDRFGPINGENPIDELYDSQNHYVYGTLSSEAEKFLNIYHQDTKGGGWNQTNVGDGNGNKFCSFQTVPEEYSSCPNPPENFVAYYTLDRSDSSTNEYLNNYDGTTEGGVTQAAEGKIGNAYDFDGIDGWVNLSDSLSTEMADSGLTFSAWIRNPGSSRETIISASQQDGTDSAVFRINNKLEFRVSGTSYTSLDSAASSAWTHVAVKINDSTNEGAFYINGTKNGTFTTSERIGSDDTWALGQNFQGGTSLSDTSDHFDGRMDEVRIYNKPLKDETINSIGNPQSNLGTEIEESLAFPDRITRAKDSIDLEGYYDNNAGENAENAYLNWTLESGWDVVEGDRSRFDSSVSPGQRVYNNITSEPSITSSRGSTYINLSSNSSNVAGSKSFEILDVYAETSVSNSIDKTDVLLGESFTVSSELLLDTGAALENQRLDITDEKSRDFLGNGLTDSNGELTREFNVPEDWLVGQHTIKTDYSGNSSEYTNPSDDQLTLNVHDKPKFESTTAEPERTGFGFEIKINSSVIDKDGVQSVDLKVEKPSGDQYTETMTEISDRIYESNFTETFENGKYNYSIEATDQAGYTSTSISREFKIRANASNEIVTGKDIYGPNEAINLDRESDVERNITEKENVLTKQIYAEELYSASFDTLTGVSTDHTDTHSRDGNLFSMTEQDGSAPDTPDEFEGVYTYETELSGFETLEISSYGSVTAETWSVSARNYDTGAWDEIFTVSNTANQWNNLTICSGSTCDNYVENGEIEIRVFAQSGRNSDQASYNVDYQDIRTEASSGPTKKEESLDEPYRVGSTRFAENRLYSKFDISQMPFYRSGTIQNADLYLNVSGGFGTGEVHHTQNFALSEDAETIHADGEPSESEQSNPVVNFTTSTGLKRINITQSLNSTFEAGKEYYGIQLREQDETTYYDIEEPIYIGVNYTVSSQIFNSGDTNISGYMLMRVQRNESGGWDNVGFPVVSPGDGNYRIDEGESLDLASLWSSNGGFNTGLRESGKYRVLSRFTDSGGNTLQTDSGKEIRDTYNFEILGPQLNLTDINHENLEQQNLNEYETRDNIEFVNITVNNSKAEAVNASALLQVLNQEEEKVSWGPDSLKILGDIPAGSSAEERWDKDGNGYTIPEEASSGDFTFRWNTTLNADNAEVKSNYSVNFLIHDVPSNFSSRIEATDNQVLRNESTLYNFSVYNPWSGQLNDLNVTVNVDEEELNGTVQGTNSDTANIGTLQPGNNEHVLFNISTNVSTAVDNYDINATIEYNNPGGERREWKQRNNKILKIRIPGSLLNITQAPDTVTRGQEGYSFDSYANNTFSQDLTDVSLTWEIPEDWNNQSQNLEVEQSVQPPGDLIYNNFTGEISPDERLGEYRINETTDNDQGRVDEEFIYIDVYANTSLGFQINDTNPAVNETIKLSGNLNYDNGTPVSEQTIRFRDEETGELIDNKQTNSEGEAVIDYRVDSPLGNHTLNATYAGSDSKYLRPSENLTNVTVRDRPNVTDVTVDPFITGFGFNRTINATVQDQDDISNVNLEMVYPSGREDTFSMQNVGSDVYEYNFSNTWELGVYSFKVTAEDEFGIESSNSSEFYVDLTQKSSIQTEKNDYYPDQNVNLTDDNRTWWNTDFNYRREINLTETNGNNLVRYPTEIELQNHENSNSCNDLRFTQNDLTTGDVYVESCNPSGTSKVFVSSNVTSGSTTRDFIYYGNDTASEDEEFFAYPITDSGVVDPGDTSLDRNYEYNSGNSAFRQVEVTMFGEGFSGTVTADYYQNDSSVTLFDGEPASGTTVVAETYYDNPKFNSVRVQMSDGGGGQANDVSFEYNFTTPESSSSIVGEEQKKLPSVIESFDYPFRGRIVLEVLRNESGSFEQVESVVNQSSPSTITGAFGFHTLWNKNPFYTGSRDPGDYRARFRLKDPYGNVLEDTIGKIERTFDFRLNPPRSEVNFEDIRAFNVTDSADQRTDTADLEDSGVNSTLEIKGNQTYRFELNINNSESADQAWSIDSQDSVRFGDINSSWNVVDIYYENETQTFEGGSFNGNVTWDTSNGGEVEPGTEANFTFIVEVPNVNDLRNVKSVINDTAFTREDSSELKVVKKENIPPTALQFNVSSNITRGEQLNASAYWDELIDVSQAEYNSTSEVLNNFTVTPENRWTNYSTVTDTEWARGSHQFRFWASDSNGNTNSTVTETFDVFGTASVEQSSINETNIAPGEPVRFRCQIVSDSGDGVGNYNVSFFNSTQRFDYSATNSTGWAETTYSSDQTGFQDLSCDIDRDLDRFFLTGVQNLTETVRVAEVEAPNWFESGANGTRFFKTSLNTTGKWYSYWKDNSELDTAALIRDTGYYSYTQNEYIHGIKSGGSSLIDSINGTGAIDEGLDNFDHLIYGTTRGKDGENLDIYHAGGENGGWNNSVIANATAEYCVIQTQPTNRSSCQRSGSLVSLYLMDEEGTKAWDHVGKNHGELEGSISQGSQGYIGQGYDFDDTDDFVNLSDQPSNNMAGTGFTLSAWIKNPGSGIETVIASNQVDGSVSGAFRVNSELELRVDGTSYTSNTNARSSAWTHVAVSVNDSTGEGTFYLNGSEDGTFSTSTRFNSDDIWSIGQKYDGSIDTASTAEFFNGTMDNVRLYNRSLGSAEIQDLYGKDTEIGPENRIAGDLPESDFPLEPLDGSEDWSNITVDIPIDYPLGDFDWSIYANDTSSNINTSRPVQVDVWAWAFNDEEDSEATSNPVAIDETFGFQCRYRQGNGTNIQDYSVSFWDNNTADGSLQKLGTNKTGDDGTATWYQSYSDTGANLMKCNVTENSDLNVKPFEGFKQFNETIEVSLGDVEPPVIINDNYGINASEIYKGFDSVLSYAEWNETIGYSYIEYNSTNSSLQTEKISEPYSENFTNTTIDTNSSWKVGTHQIKTYANDTEGNLNDTLEYLIFDVFGYSEANWIEPTGSTEKGLTDLKCRVSDNQTGSGISDYAVEFFDDNNNFIGSNQTGSDGSAVYTYNTSDLSAGEKTWSCRIQDEPELYYNASSQNSDSETVELVDQISSQVTGNITEPLNNTKLAQNKTFKSNISIRCIDGDCGQVNATLRYNASGSSPDTSISETSGTPFYTIGSNPQTCGTLNQGERCNVTFEVNATGSVGSIQSLDAEIKGENTQLNDTENIRVGIEELLILNVNYSEVDYGIGSPGTAVGAESNAENQYVVSLDENSNDATGGLWGNMSKMTNTEREATDTGTTNNKIRPVNSTWDKQSTCAYSASEKFQSGFTRFKEKLSSGESFAQCYFQEIPYGKYEGAYQGALTIKVNRTN